MHAVSIESPQTSTGRSNLIAAFRRVVASTGRRQATDLHVRRLLCYVRAKDVDGQGARRSLKQIADRLVLSVSTCRRVIRRAVKHFGLLIVIPQRNIPGGQTANRYSINWKNVDTILGITAVSSSVVQLARAARTRARSKCILPTLSTAEIRPSCYDLAPTSHRMLAAITRCPFGPTLLEPVLNRFPFLHSLAPSATYTNFIPPARCDQAPHPQFNSEARTIFRSCYDLAPDEIRTNSHTACSLRSSATPAIQQRCPHHMPVVLRPRTSGAPTSPSVLRPSFFYKPIRPCGSHPHGNAPSRTDQPRLYLDNTFARAARIHF